MQLCDAFDLPIAVPVRHARDHGRARRSRRPRWCATVSRMFVTGANLTVPFFTIVLRKGYGLGAQAMAGGSFKAPLFTRRLADRRVRRHGPRGRGAARLPQRARRRSTTRPSASALFEEMVDAHVRARQGAEHGVALRDRRRHRPGRLPPLDHRRARAPRRRRRRAPARSARTSTPGDPHRPQDSAAFERTSHPGSVAGGERPPISRSPTSGGSSSSPPTRRMASSHPRPAERLEQLTTRLVTEKRWEAARGFALTDDMRVTIAAQAALLVLGLGYDCYDDIRSIIVHPTTIVLTGEQPGPVAGVRDRRAGRRCSARPTIEGPVLIAWDAALAQARHPERRPQRRLPRVRPQARHARRHGRRHAAAARPGDAAAVDRRSAPPSTTRCATATAGRAAARLRRGRTRASSSPSPPRSSSTGPPSCAADKPDLYAVLPRLLPPGPRGPAAP